MDRLQNRDDVFRIFECLGLLVNVGSNLLNDTRRQAGYAASSLRNGQVALLVGQFIQGTGKLWARSALLCTARNRRKTFVATAHGAGPLLGTANGVFAHVPRTPVQFAAHTPGGLLCGGEHHLGKGIVKCSI